jgi:hypothetical protein
MLHLFEQNQDLFTTWFVVRYEREGDAYLLQIGAILRDGSRLELRDYLFVDDSRKYAYHWMEADGKLRQRWDNAPHWPDITTKPHHTHLPGQEKPEPSTITNIQDLLSFLRQWFDEQS